MIKSRTCFLYKKRRRTFKMSKAKGGLILGIVALVSAILGCVGPFGFTVSMILILASLPLAIVGLVLSVMGGKELKAQGISSGAATAGLIVGIVSTVICGILFVSCGLCAICANEAGKSLKDSFS